MTGRDASDFICRDCADRRGVMRTAVGHRSGPCLFCSTETSWERFVPPGAKLVDGECKTCGCIAGMHAMFEREIAALRGDVVNAHVSGHGMGQESAAAEIAILRVKLETATALLREVSGQYGMPIGTDERIAAFLSAGEGAT